MSNVLYVLELKLNLFSTGAALDKGLQMTSNSRKCTFLKNDIVVAIGIRDNHLYRMLFRIENSEDQNLIGEANLASTRNSLHLWHERLAHQNVVHVKESLKQRSIPFDNVDGFSCDACSVGKHCRKPFHSITTKSKIRGELVHSDVCGPMLQCSQHLLVDQDISYCSRMIIPIFAPSILFSIKAKSRRS